MQTEPPNAERGSFVSQLGSFAIKWLKKDIAYENSDCIGAFGVKGTVFQSLKVSKNRVETMSKPPCWLSEFC